MNDHESNAPFYVALRCTYLACDPCIPRGFPSKCQKTRGNRRQKKIEMMIVSHSSTSIRTPLAYEIVHELSWEHAQQ